MFVNLEQVKFLHTDVSKWPITSRVTAIRFVPGKKLAIEHTKAGKWPVADDVEGNPHVIANYEGRWYSATYEWLRPGQTEKSIHAGNIGSKIGTAPLDKWVPQSGELVGLFVSTHARFNERTSNERSNVVWVHWNDGTILGTEDQPLPVPNPPPTLPPPTLPPNPDESIIVSIHDDLKAIRSLLERVAARYGVTQSKDWASEAVDDYRQRRELERLQRIVDHCEQYHGGEE